MCMQSRTDKHLAIIAQLYGKTRVKCTIEKTASCVYTVFSRVYSKPVHLYRVLPGKMRIPRSCRFTRVLSSKSQKRVPNWTPKWVPFKIFWAGSGIIYGKTRVFLHAHAKNTGFYRVNRHLNRLKWPQNGGPGKYAQCGASKMRIIR